MLKQKRITIRVRLLLGFMASAVLTGLCAGVGILALVQMRNIMQTFTETIVQNSDMQLQQGCLLSDIRKLVADVNAVENPAALADDGALASTLETLKRNQEVRQAQETLDLVATRLIPTKRAMFETDDRIKANSASIHTILTKITAEVRAAAGRVKSDTSMKLLLKSEEARKALKSNADVANTGLNKFDVTAKTSLKTIKAALASRYHLILIDSRLRMAMEIDDPANLRYSVNDINETATKLNDEINLLPENDTKKQLAVDIRNIVTAVTSLLDRKKTSLEKAKDSSEINPELKSEWDTITGKIVALNGRIKKLADATDANTEMDLLLESEQARTGIQRESGVVQKSFDDLSSTINTSLAIMTYTASLEADCHQLQSQINAVNLTQSQKDLNYIKSEVMNVLANMTKNKAQLAENKVAIDIDIENFKTNVDNLFAEKNRQIDVHLQLRELLARADEGATADSISAKIDTLEGEVAASITHQKGEVTSTSDRTRGKVATWQKVQTALGAVAVVIAIVLGLIIARAITRIISRTITTVASNTNEIGGAIHMISNSSRQLAEGASRQASNLEESSASLEEMATMIKQNADNAGQANELMESVRKAMDENVQAMERMTDEINKIRESAKETVKIIKTIDDIAFQTNLLALNAAVEAARSGEAGKGFAVVAEEVRTLAQKSAEAARTTSHLIEGSKKNAESGVTVTAELAKSMQATAEFARKVASLVAEIAVASKEQAEGINQVNSAVAEMDKVVQHNAASAEESASASEELNSQAEELDTVVSELTVLIGGNSFREKTEPQVDMKDSTESEESEELETERKSAVEEEVSQFAEV